MNKREILLELVQYDKNTINNVLESAMDEYTNKITYIAMDIYDSCIKQFYRKYTPRIYTRHGDKSGFNLYYANDIELNNLKLDIGFEPNNLLPYNKNEEDNFKRNVVLSSVMKGVRARKSPRMPYTMRWSASYPNEYSRYTIWSSGGQTMDRIFSDFCKNVITDTMDEFYKMLLKHM